MRQRGDVCTRKDPLALLGRCSPSRPLADAKLQYKDSVTYATQNVALYADADTPDSSVGSLTLSDKRAKGSVTFSDTTLTFVADFEIVCP